MTVNAFEFYELNDLNEFIKYAESKFDKFIEFRHNGIDLMEAPEYGHKFAMVGHIDENLNFVDIKVQKVYIEDVPIKVNMPVGSMVETGLVKDKRILLHGSGIEVLERINPIVNQKLLIYENMKITIFINENKYSVNVEEKDLSPFKAEIYENYIKILGKDFDYDFSKELIEEHSLFYSITRMIKLRDYLIEHDIYLDKFNSPDIISYLLNASENGLNYEDGKTEFLFYKTSKGYIGRSNYNDRENNILKELVLYNIYNNDKPEIEFTGYSLIFSLVNNQYMRQCLNFNYIDMLKKDKIQLENNLPDELLFMIVYNYLLIYWEYENSKLMLKILKNAIKKRIPKTESIPLLINYLQLRKILGEKYNQEETKKIINLANGINAIPNEFDVNIVKLICSVLLERRQECKIIYNELNKDLRDMFDGWPIKYLYDELIK